MLYTFKIKMRVLIIAVLSVLFLATFAQAESISADDSLQVLGGESLSDEDIDLISEESEDDSELSDEEDEYDFSGLSEDEIAQLQEKFKFYGNFCGPGYCGGSHIQEQSGTCNWNVKPKDSTDKCCFDHDKCCGSKSTRSPACNQNMLSCLRNNAKCPWWNVDCHFKRGLMVAAFAIVKNKVCGE
jgi:hypothetical protein